MGIVNKKNQEGEIWRNAIKDQFGNENFDKLMLAIGTPDARRFMSDEAKTKFTIDYMHQPNGLSEAVKFATIGLLTAGVGSGILGTAGTAAKTIGRTLSATKAGKIAGKALTSVGDFSKRQWKNFLTTRAGQGLVTAGQTVKASLPPAGIYLGLQNYYSPEGYRKTQRLFNETIDSFKRPTKSATHYSNIFKTVKSGLGDILDLSMIGDLTTITPQLEFGLKNAYDVLKRTKITMPKNTLSCGIPFPSLQTMGTPDRQLYKFVSDPRVDGVWKVLNSQTGNPIGYDDILPALYSAHRFLGARGSRGADIAKIGLSGKDVVLISSKSRIPKGINKDDIILDVSDFTKPDIIVNGENIKFTTNIEDLESYINNINSKTSGIILLDRYGKQIGSQYNYKKKLQDALKIIHENVTKPDGSLNDAFANGVKISDLDKDFIRNNIDYVQIAQDIARNDNIKIENGKFFIDKNIIPADSYLYYFMHGFEPYNKNPTKAKDFWFSPFTKETTSILPLNYVSLLQSVPEKQQKIFLEELRKSNNQLYKTLFENDALKEKQFKDNQTLNYIRQVLQERLGSNYHVHAVDRHSYPDAPKIYKNPIPFLGKSVGINPMIYSNPELQTALARVLQRMTGDVGGSMVF